MDQLQPGVAITNPCGCIWFRHTSEFESHQILQPLKDPSDNAGTVEDDQKRDTLVIFESRTGQEMDNA